MNNTHNLSFKIIHDDVNWIRILSSNRQTIEDLFDFFTELTKSTPQDAMILYLLDSNGITDLPIRYLIQRAEKWEKDQPYILPTRTAILYEVNSLMRFAINMLIKRFGKYDNESRIFPPDQYDEAIEWLKSAR